MVGQTELLLIFGIALLLFGSKRLPELGRSLGEGIRNFKRGLESREEGVETVRRSRNSGGLLCWDLWLVSPFI